MTLLCLPGCSPEHPDPAAVPCSSEGCLSPSYCTQVTEHLLSGVRSGLSRGPLLRLSRCTSDSGVLESEPLAAGTVTPPPARSSYFLNTEGGRWSVFRGHTSLIQVVVRGSQHTQGLFCLERGLCAGPRRHWTLRSCVLHEGILQLSRKKLLPRSEAARAPCSWGPGELVLNIPHPCCFLMSASDTVKVYTQESVETQPCPTPCSGSVLTDCLFSVAATSQNPVVPPSSQIFNYSMSTVVRKY